MVLEGIVEGCRGGGCSPGLVACWRGVPSRLFLLARRGKRGGGDELSMPSRP